MDAVPCPDELVPSCVLVRNEAAVIVAVEGAVRDVLGWSAADLVGLPSTLFIHPEDQPSAVAAWFEMISNPGSTKIWRGRYRSEDGAWRWIEAANTNRLDDRHDPRVVSSIVRVTDDQVSVEEELRARKQLLSQLSDALPVGLFQIDTGRLITFTNDRLHAIIDAAPAATVDAQFASLLPADRDRLDAAIAAALSDHAVDDLEVRFVHTASDAAGTRVCLISLRSLTDGTGVVTGAIGCLSDVTDSARLRRDLQLRASVDALTGCMNRGATLELVESLLREQPERLDGLAVIYIDLDNFKTVNDCHGHAAGDAVLVAAVQQMLSVLRYDDRVGRLGGDEFLIVCPKVMNETAAIELADRVRVSLSSTVRIGDIEVDFQATTGVAWADNDASADALVARADHAMYRAKPKPQSA